jgi:hypothetical protein
MTLQVRLVSLRQRRRHRKTFGTSDLGRCGLPYPWGTLAPCRFQLGCYARPHNSLAIRQRKILHLQADWSLILSLDVEAIVGRVDLVGAPPALWTSPLN